MGVSVFNFPSTSKGLHVNPVDIVSVATEFGLFVALVVACILAMGLVIRAIWMAYREEVSGRREDQKLATAQILESARIMDRAVDVVSARRD
jgi:hypothetical protein